MMTEQWRLSAAFDRAAPTYDAMVALSPGYHAQLRRSADALLARIPDRGAARLRVADLGCGSGASTAALLEAFAHTRPGTPLEVTAVDLSSGMLAEAGAKDWPEGVTFVEKDALSWLGAQASGSLDAVLAAYLLRNVPDREAVVQEIARVLAPGGAVALQDYSVAGRPVARAAWAAICHGMIIPLAVLKRSDVPLHRYLYRSVGDFDSVAVMSDRLTRACLRGAEHVTHGGLQGAMVHTVTAAAP